MWIDRFSKKVKYSGRKISNIHHSILQVAFEFWKLQKANEMLIWHIWVKNSLIAYHCQTLQILICLPLMMPPAFLSPSDLISRSLFCSCQSYHCWTSHYPLQVSYLSQIVFVPAIFSLCCLTHQTSLRFRIYLKNQTSLRFQTWLTAMTKVNKCVTQIVWRLLKFTDFKSGILESIHRDTPAICNHPRWSMSGVTLSPV